MNARLSRWTDIVIALSCLTVAGLFIEQRFFGSPAPAAVANNEESALVGKKAPEIAGVSYKQAPHTLMIVVRSTCKFCNESMPFWKRLMERRGSGDNARLRVIAVSSESAQISTEYLRQHGLVVDQVASGRLGAHSTPMLVLIDSEGIIKKAWIGKAPGPAAEDAILKAVL